MTRSSIMIPWESTSMHRIIAIIVGLVTGGLRMITLPTDSEVGQATAWN
jgi:hypothetical protein